MNLKKIEVYGFKSFADKLEIEFNSPFTGIVGPNGCGKSNFADAVRWVLGEQRPSVLRCNKSMLEVIFNGTANRRSLSYCEVSLYLDNEKGQYPVNYDEVVITRKLYRSGDSEYYINRNACRLRDIVDLFRDSGIGREGYSIIGQGRVEDILSARPEARRQIFEEAAGISRHKARKIETERKLERTRENLSRINDILTEVESRLEPLEQEAKDAAKARELRQKLKFLEISSFLYHSENSSAERTKITQKLENTIKEIEAKETQLASLNKEYNNAMMDIANSDIYANNLREQITKLMVSNERKDGESRLLTERLNNLLKQSQDITTENIQLESRLGEREKEKAQLFVEFNEKNATLLEKKEAYTKLQESLDILNKSVDEQEKTIEMSNKLLFDSMGEISELDKDKVKLELERDILINGLGESKEVYKEKSSALASITKERDALENAYEELLKEREEKTGEKTLADTNLLAALSELKETENKKRQLEDRKNELVIKINMLEEYKRDYSGYQDVIRRLMNDAKHDSSINEMVLGTVGQIISVPKDLQLAVEIALGGSIQNIITETPNDAGRLIDILKNKGYGRATFLPISTIRPNPLHREYDRVLDETGVIGVASELIRYQPKFDNVISNLLGKTIIVDDKEVGIRISQKYKNAFRIVTLDGALFAQSGAMTGGTAPGRNTRILSRDTELADLNKKLKNTIKELEILSADIGDLTIEKDELDRGAKIIDARIHKLDVELGNLNTRLLAMDGEINSIQAEIDKILATNSANSERIEQLNKLILVAEKSHDTLRSEKVSADDFINEAKDKFFNDKQKRDALSKEVTEALVALTAVQNQLDNINRDLATNKSEIYHINQSLLDLKARRATSDAEVKKVQSLIDTTVYDDTDKAKLEDMRQEVAQIDEHKKNMQARVGELDIARTECSKSINEIVERRTREESALERVDSVIENLSVRISQDYDMDYHAAKAYMENREAGEEEIPFEPTKAGAESLSLRRKIERIGPINELAEEKFVSEKERHQEMKVQYEDLVKAEGDLIKIIADLTSEMEVKFAKSFKQINENFEVVFKELFGGGTAKLELDTDSNQGILEAGIEIKAQPPGLALSSIRLLSGGQRALTAIAILFAIIKLKPMPFCILDEIEAALDDSNAALFAQFLQRFAKSTQFIVVTHRKPTMAHADMLYGVTMQEKGVSNLVSVQLAEALETAEEGA